MRGAHRCADCKSSSLYDRNVSNSDRTGNVGLAVLAESDITGLPYGSSAPDAQPRTGNAVQDTCQPGTLSNQEGQR